MASLLTLYHADKDRISYAACGWISLRGHGCLQLNNKEPLNQSAAALSGSFVPAYRFENLEIHKVFLQFPNLNLEQNPSLTALAIESEVPKGTGCRNRVDYGSRFLSAGISNRNRGFFSLCSDDAACGWPCSRSGGCAHGSRQRSARPPPAYASCRRTCRSADAARRPRARSAC